MKKDKALDFNEKRKEKTRKALKKVLKKLRIPLAIILVIVIIVVSLAAMGETRRSNISDSFRAIPATIGESAGYPYNEDVLTLSKVSLIGDKPLLVNANGVEVLSQNADKLYTLHLDWADTKVSSINGRAFVYSTSSQKAYLISRTKKLAEFSEDGTIVTGTVGNNGSVALTYSTDEAQSVVKVYTPKHENEFKWNCSKDYVSSLALSSSGKRVVVSAVGVDNAEIYSRVMLFKTKNDDADFDIPLNGTCILKTIYTSSNKIIAIGDNKTVIFNAKGESVKEITYSENSLFAVDSDKDGNTLLCYKQFGGAKIDVTKISSSGKISDSFEIDFTPASVDMRNNTIIFALDNRILTYNSSGKKKDDIECANRISTCLITDTAYYTLENGTICKY